MSFYRIEEVWKWGEDRGLYEHSTFEAQMVKLIEEAGELLQAINANDREGVKDAIGDCMVVIGHLVKFAGVSFEPAKSVEKSSHPVLLDWSSLVAHIGLISASKSTYNFRGAIHFLWNIADHFDLTLTECIDHVIPIINARTGKFNEHGIWVKDPQPVAESSLAGNVISVK